MSRVELRVGVAVVGMVLAFAGIVLQHGAIVWVAIGVLGLAFALRLVGTRPDPARNGDPGDSPQR